ncbi:MAG: hypothetical protein EOM25_04730 [Deltaproteobacteria bacterium]|nr:hypothetical protein [Deltaproteobacteria bacterium]
MAHGLDLVVEERVPVLSEGTFTLLAGPNGAGKTSLIEKLLLPGLSASKVVFAYVVQDFSLQKYAMMAELAVRGRTGGGETEICRNWVEACPGIRVLVLDEYDKLGPVDPLVQACPGIDAMLAVSHGGREPLLRAASGRFKRGGELGLTPLDGRRGEVRVDWGPLWP